MNSDHLDKNDRKKRFSATLRVIVITEVPLRAKTYEDAVKEAHELQERDIVEFSTDFLDGSIKVASVNRTDVKWDD